MPTTILDKVIINAGEETTSKPILVYNPVTKRVYWQTSPIPRIEALEAKLDTDNNFKIITGYAFNEATRVLTMNAEWVGAINGVDYTNVAAVPLPAIPLAASGYSRIDLIVFNTAGTFVIVPGTQSTNTPVKPAKLVNTLEATFVTVNDTNIIVPVVPKPKAPVTSVNGMRGDVIIPTASKATDTTAGIVKTDVTEVDPVVYTKETTDNLLDGKANYFLDIKNITGITYNVILTDILNELVYSGTLPMNVIIPNNTVVPFPIGTMFYTLGTSTGIITASGAAGVTLNVKAGISLSAIQNEVRQYTKIGVNTWSVRGDLNLGAVTQTELSYLQGLRSNAQVQIDAKTALSGGTANFLMKWLTATTATVSRIWDTGTFLGIDTVNAPTKDLAFGNQADREIGIEISDNTTIGRSLILRAGKAINYAPTGFINLNPEPRTYKKITHSSTTNNVYVIYGQFGGLGKQTNSTGQFVAQTGFPWGVTDIYSYNGDLYITTDSNQNGTGLVYKQTGETGAWVSIGAPARRYSCLTITLSGNLYLGVINGSIYKQTGLTGAFVDLVQSNRIWMSLASSSDGSVYAGASAAFLGKQTAGVGDFNFISVPNAVYYINAITVTPNNNLYVTHTNENSGAGTVYYKVNSEGAFIALESTNNFDVGLAASSNGNVYLTSNNSIYIQQNYAVGIADLDGGTLKQVAGTGKGTGKSRYEIYTGQKTASGTDMQIETLREYVDENGFHIYTSMPVYADNAAALTGGLPVGCKYRNATGDLKIVY